MKTMDKPYTNAFLIAWIRLVLELVKKVTVMGTMGKTHGVTSASNPAAKDSTMNSYTEDASVDWPRSLSLLFILLSFSLGKVEVDKVDTADCIVVSFFRPPVMAAVDGN